MLNKNYREDRFCVEFFSTLANPLRLAILQSLIEKEKTVYDITESVKEERTLVSHNLARLLNANLVYFKQVGKSRIYYANHDIVAPLFYLIENFVCRGCSFRKTCKIMGRKSISPKSIQIDRETCPGCIKR